LKEIGSNSLSYIKFVPNTQLVIPDKVTTLGKQMFDGAKGITRIEIPTSVIQIGCNSFSMAMNNPSADILSIVKIKRTASVYQYLVPRPTSNWGTNPFEY
jgi:hypothetical protein